MASFQSRLKKVMKKRGWRVADLARAFGRPYTSVREWVLFGRDPGDARVDRRLVKLEQP